MYGYIQISHYQLKVQFDFSGFSETFWNIPEYRPMEDCLAKTLLEIRKGKIVEIIERVIIDGKNELIKLEETKKPLSAYYRTNFIKFPVLKVGDDLPDIGVKYNVQLIPYLEFASPIRSVTVQMVLDRLTIFFKGYANDLNRLPEPAEIEILRDDTYGILAFSIEFSIKSGGKKIGEGSWNVNGWSTETVDSDAINFTVHGNEFRSRINSQERLEEIYFHFEDKCYQLSYPICGKHFQNSIKPLSYQEFRKVDRKGAPIPIGIHWSKYSEHLPNWTMTYSEGKREGKSEKYDYSGRLIYHDMHRDNKLISREYLYPIHVRITLKEENNYLVQELNEDGSLDAEYERNERAIIQTTSPIKLRLEGTQEYFTVE